MTVQLTVPEKKELRPRISVIGVGGAGGNAVNNMIKAGLSGVEFFVVNTDAQALAGSSCENRIQIGTKLTEGLGAGSDPEVGREAAEESLSEIIDYIDGSHMAFITAGMGGGTGTGAAPVIARACKEKGILTVGVVTKPFNFEGVPRMKSAEKGISTLSEEVDTLIIIPNQNLFRVATEKTGFVEAFAIADEVLHSGVASVTDLVTKPGLVNLDFADVKMVMSEMGKAMMGTGEAEGEGRAIAAAEIAIANPLLEDDSMRGASGVLINITGGQDMTLYEVDEATNRVRAELPEEARIIVGAIFDESLTGQMRISVVATGIDTAEVVPFASKATMEQNRYAAVEEDEPMRVEEEALSPLSEVPPAPDILPKHEEQLSDSENASVPSFLKSEPAVVKKYPLPKRSMRFLDKLFSRKSEKASVVEEKESDMLESSDEVSSPSLNAAPSTPSVSPSEDEQGEKMVVSDSSVDMLVDTRSEDSLVSMLDNVETVSGYQDSMITERANTDYNEEELDIPAFLRR